MFILMCENTKNENLLNSFFYYLLPQWYYFILIKKFNLQNQILEVGNQGCALRHQENWNTILLHRFYKENLNPL